MPALKDCTDLDLMAQGLVTLDEIERDGPVLANTLQCLALLPPRMKLGYVHDWSPPFIAADFNDRGEDIHSDVQQCWRCGAVRATRFGPYLGDIRLATPPALR